MEIEDQINDALEVIDFVAFNKFLVENIDTRFDSGKTTERLCAVPGVLPAQFDTKNPSTTEYMEVKTTIAMEGAINFMSLPNVK